MYIYTKRGRVIDGVLLAIIAATTAYDFYARQFVVGALLAAYAVYFSWTIVRRKQWDRATSPAFREAYHRVFREITMVVDKTMPLYVVVIPGSRSYVTVQWHKTPWYIRGANYVADLYTFDDDATPELGLATRSCLIFPASSSSLMTMYVQQVEILEDGTVIQSTRGESTSRFAELRAN